MCKDNIENSSVSKLCVAACLCPPCVCVFMHISVRRRVHLQKCMQHRSPSFSASSEVYLGSGRDGTHVYTGGTNP